jgi:hypothetical protein
MMTPNWKTAASVSPPKGWNAIRRYPQIAATTAVPAFTFRGIHELSGTDRICFPRTAPLSVVSRDATHALDSTPSDSECEDAVANLSDPSDLDSDLLLRVAKSLCLKAREAASRADYDEAAVLTQKRMAVMHELKARRHRPPSREEAQEFSGMIEAQRATRARELADFDAETKRHLSSIRHRHRSELRAFDDYWVTVEQEKYRKPSALLMRQRIMEANLIRHDELERARGVHEEVEITEEREFAEAQQQYALAYKDAREFRIAGQDEETRLFKWQRGCDRLNLIRKIEREERILYNRLNVLQEKPVPLESFRDLIPDPVASRPIVPLPASFDPEKKLQKLAVTTPGRARTAMNRHSAPEISIKTSRRSTQARSEQGPRPRASTTSSMD